MRNIQFHPRIPRSRRRIIGGAVAATLLLSQTVNAASPSSPAPRHFEDALRRTILLQGDEGARFRMADRMDHYGVPGVSVAIIEGCRIVDARGFGFGAGGGMPITPSTLFQAGSISKSITAVAALSLVQQGKLQLDTDVRPSLPNWNGKDRSSSLAATVTLRRLLNHTAGLNEVGGRGYDRGAPLPTLAQIINGAPPANTPPIRIETEPGKKWAYSSGGYYLVQELMSAATGQSFPDLAQKLVFEIAGMDNSSFAQPLQAAQSQFAADAAGPDGLPMRGGWRVNPELAAGGLWTTPTDLARFLITLSRDIRGESERLLDHNAIDQMLTPGLQNWGLGVELQGPGAPRRIGHTGHNVGFVSEYVMYPDTCQGAVVMTNGDEGGWLITETLRAISDEYHWPEPRASSVQAAVPLSEAISRRFVGTYQLRDFPSEKFTISQKPGGGLYWARVGHIGRDLLPEQEGRLFSPDSRMKINALDPRSPKAMFLEVSFGGGKNVAQRVE